MNGWRWRHDVQNEPRVLQSFPATGGSGVGTISQKNWLGHDPFNNPDKLASGVPKFVFRLPSFTQQGVGVLFVFGGEQRWQIAPACRYNQFRPKLSSGVHSKESMAEPILL